MAVSSLLGLQTALRGLLAYQQGIETTGNNITNASTPGYSRETVDLTESAPMVIPEAGNNVQLGTGVDVTTISRIRDQFLDIQYRAQNTTSGNANTNVTLLNQVQTALAEPTDHGLAAQMSAFWGAWSDVANSPQDPAARQTLVDSAQTLAQSFNALDQQMGTVQAQAGQQYAALTGTSGVIASDAAGIAALNNTISQAVAAGQTPNELQDQRDKLLDDLSSYGTVSVTTQGNGMLQVNFGDAASPLVNGTTVTWPQTLTSATGGQLGALISLSSPTGQIAGYRASLDAIANQLVSSVNSLHTSTPFFSGTSAATIAVAATPSTVQTSSTGAPGGNDVAQKITALRGGSVDQSYASFVAQIGGDIQSDHATQQTAKAVLSNVDNQRQSVSGVQADEEMTNRLTFQRGYQATARMMTTVDGMLDTLINHTGVVGL